MNASIVKNQVGGLKQDGFIELTIAPSVPLCLADVFPNGTKVLSTMPHPPTKENAANSKPRGYKPSAH